MKMKAIDGKCPAHICNFKGRTFEFMFVVFQLDQNINKSWLYEAVDVGVVLLGQDLFRHQRLPPQRNIVNEEHRRASTQRKTAESWWTPMLCIVAKQDISKFDNKGRFACDIHKVVLCELLRTLFTYRIVYWNYAL